MERFSRGRRRPQASLGRQQRDPFVEWRPLLESPTGGFEKPSTANRYNHSYPETAVPHRNDAAATPGSIALPRFPKHTDIRYKPSQRAECIRCHMYSPGRDVGAEAHRHMLTATFGSKSSRDLDQFLIRQGCQPDEPSPGYYDAHSSDPVHEPAPHTDKHDVAAAMKHVLHSMPRCAENARYPKESEVRDEHSEWAAQRFLISQGCQPDERSPGNLDGPLSDKEVNGPRVLTPGKAASHQAAPNSAAPTWQRRECSRCLVFSERSRRSISSRPRVPNAVFASASQRNLDDFLISKGCQPDEPSPGYYDILWSSMGHGPMLRRSNEKMYSQYGAAEEDGAKPNPDTTPTRPESLRNRECSRCWVFSNGRRRCFSVPPRVPTEPFTSMTSRDFDRYVLSQGCQPDEPSPGSYGSISPDSGAASLGLRNRAGFGRRTPRFTHHLTQYGPTGTSEFIGPGVYDPETPKFTHPEMPRFTHHLTQYGPTGTSEFIQSDKSASRQSPMAAFRSESPRRLEQFLISQGCSPEEPTVGSYSSRSRSPSPSKGPFGGRSARFRWQVSNGTSEEIGPGTYNPWQEEDPPVLPRVSIEYDRCGECVRCGMPMDPDAPTASSSNNQDARHRAPTAPDASIQPQRRRRPMSAPSQGRHQYEGVEVIGGGVTIRNNAAKALSRARTNTRNAGPKVARSPQQVSADLPVNVMPAAGSALDLLRRHRRSEDRPWTYADIQ